MLFLWPLNYLNGSAKSIFKKAQAQSVPHLYIFHSHPFFWSIIWVNHWPTFLWLTLHVRSAFPAYNKTIFFLHAPPLLQFFHIGKNTVIMVSDLLIFFVHCYFCNYTLKQEDTIINHFIYTNKELLGGLQIKLVEVMGQSSSIHSSTFSHFLLAKLWIHPLTLAHTSRKLRFYGLCN